MPICRVCKKSFLYNTDVGYAKDLCGPICDGISIGLNKRPIPQDAYCFFRDGDKWCCVRGDFVSILKSPDGFGYTFDEAMSDLTTKLPIG